jgi:hypothetical protein
MTMPELVYILCAGASLFCAFLLFRSYRAQRNQLLLWSTLCFLGLAANSIVLVIDLAIVPELDLRLLRTGIAFGAMLVFVVALLLEAK